VTGWRLPAGLKWLTNNISGIAANVTQEMIRKQSRKAGRLT
jgi:hypothetical protein